MSTATVKLGLITSETGAASAEYLDLPKAAQARVDVANAAGGVDGRQLQLVTCDDTSSPTANLTCAQELLSKGVFAIVDESAFVFGAYTYLQKQGIPVTGGGYDGPEWGIQPNTNMFSTSGPLDPKDPQYTQPATLMKQMGVTSVGAFGYGVSPSSSDAAKGFAFSAKYVGLNVGYLDTSLPFGTVSVTPIALAMKSKNVDGVSMEMDENTNFAILTAAKQAGVNIEFAVSATGYGQELLNDAGAVQAGQGTYFPPSGVPVELKTPATLAFSPPLAKYAKFTGVPDFDWYEGWLGVDLMVQGLRPRVPTRPARPFISGLHSVTNYTADGLLPSPENYSLADFGQAPQTECLYLTQLEGHELRGGQQR